MKCPIDNTDLVMSDRQGIEIDYCPQCRGVWLDRGELDKIIERSAGLRHRRRARSSAMNRTADRSRAATNATTIGASRSRASASPSSAIFSTSRRADLAGLLDGKPGFLYGDASFQTQTPARCGA